MTAPTVSVTCTANDQNGNPVAGALLTAKLNQTEIYAGFIVPESVEAVADANGVAVLNLWPTALGAQGSQYRVTATNPDTSKKFLDVLVSVPNSPCNLHQIIVMEPYPALDASAQALAAAQGALAPVTAQAVIATTKAGEAAASATAAAGSATTATQQATISTTKAGESAASASSAATSASTATSAKNAANTSAGAAAGSASAAATSEANALASKNAANASASAAATSETNAAASAALFPAQFASYAASLATTQAMFVDRFAFT